MHALAPKLGLNVPAAQGVGLAVPFTSQYVPTKQGKHSAWPLRFWNCPTPHATQALRDTAPDNGLCVPASQRPDGSERPEPSQNMPAGHGVHAEVLAPPME